MDGSFVVETPYRRVKAGSLQEAVKIARQQLSDDTVYGRGPTAARKSSMSNPHNAQRHISSKTRQEGLPDPHEEMLREVMERKRMTKDEAQRWWDEEYESL